MVRKKMNKEELKKHCEKQIILCLALNDYKHAEEHQVVLDILEQNQKYKEVIDKVSSQIKLYGKYNGEKCTRGFSVMTADFNKLLDILKEVK